MAADIAAQRLTCEYLVNPIGIDTARPRLSWVLDARKRAQRQTAYQVLVAGSEANLRANRGDLWDSGRVDSDQSLQVVYAGRPLISGQRCFWKVRVWDRNGRASGYSPDAFWEMGLLDRADWSGRWIARTTDTASQPAPLLRREFTLRGKVRQARVYLCGLGYHELRLNGDKVGDHHLDPGYTRYDRRALYVTHDVTRQLKPGRNVVGVMLGNGWYNVHTRAVWNFHEAPWRAAPKLLLEMRVTYENGETETIASDASWKTATGPIVFDSIYGGETYDARRERPGWDTPGYDDASWEAAQVVEAPKGMLSAQMLPPIKITNTLKPVAVTEPKPGVFIVDMGQNFAGHARLSLEGPAGTTVVMRYGERLHADGTLDRRDIAQHLIQTDPPQQFQTDTYILKGGGREVWEPRFVYHGFQYIEVTGWPPGSSPTPDNLSGRFVHTTVAPAGHFECASELLNGIQRNTRWSYLSNLQSIPTDCPHREKNGWTGDAHLAAELGMLNFHSPAFYTKWVDDLGDEQRPTGELPGIVPTGGWGYAWGNGPAWDSAFLLIPWYMYEYYGDTRILERHYDGMKRYVDYLTTKADNGIVSLGLGDWVPAKTETPVAITSTGYYYRDARIVSDAARLLGKDEDAEKYADLAESIRKAFNARFFDPQTGLYANGSQTALSCALYQGLVEPEHRATVLNRLLADIARKDGHIDTGILGSKYVPNALLENGRADVAYAMATKTTYPSWGHWLEQGATTLWEKWDGTESRNHIMFGDISAWFYKALAGIQRDPSAPAFQRIVIKPYAPADMRYARGEYQSLRGKIISGWRREQGVFTLKVVIPAGATATVHLPAAEGAKITESGRAVEKAEGVTFLRREDGHAVFEIGSGEYTFTASRTE